MTFWLAATTARTYNTGKKKNKVRISLIQPKTYHYIHHWNVPPKWQKGRSDFEP